MNTGGLGLGNDEHAISTQTLLVSSGPLIIKTLHDRISTILPQFSGVWYAKSCRIDIINRRTYRNKTFSLASESRHTTGSAI